MSISCRPSGDHQEPTSSAQLPVRYELHGERTRQLLEDRPHVAVQAGQDHAVHELPAEAAVDRRTVRLDEAEPELEVRVGEREEPAPGLRPFGDRNAFGDEPQLFEPG